MERKSSGMEENKQKYEGRRPKCPFCGSDLIIVCYEGYYEDFSYWDCPKCEKIDDYKPDYKWKGDYA